MVSPEFNVWTDHFGFGNPTYAPGATLNVTFGRFFVGGGGVAMIGEYGGFGFQGKNKWILRYELNVGYRAGHFKLPLAGIPIDDGVAGLLTISYGF